MRVLTFKGSSLSHPNLMHSRMKIIVLGKEKTAKWPDADVRWLEKIVLVILFLVLLQSLPNIEILHHRHSNCLSNFVKFDV